MNTTEMRGYQQSHVYMFVATSQGEWKSFWEGPLLYIMKAIHWRNSMYELAAVI